MENEFICEECECEISEDRYNGLTLKLEDIICVDCKHDRLDGEAESADYAWHGV